MKLKVLVFGLLFALAVLQAFSAVKKESAEKPFYSNPTTYVLSAECARTTGKVLILCSDDKIRAIAEESIGDDPGHALFLGIYAALTGQPAHLTDYAVVNAVINVTGIVALTALLYWLKLPAASIFFLAVAPLVSQRYLFNSMHTSHFGATCLAMIPAIFILATAPLDKRRSAKTWFIAAIIGLGIASLIRQSAGLMGLVAGLLAVSYRIFAAPRTIHNLAFYTVALVALYVSYNTPAIVFKARDVAYGLQPSEQMETHGIWHNLYIGLGAADNPFGISWVDSNGLEHARAINPSVKYASKEYYDILKVAYFDVVKKYPLAVARVYAEKLAMAVRHGKIWVMLLASLIPVLLLRFSGPAQKFFPEGIDATLLVSSLFVCFFLAQAALFHYAMQFLYPITVSFTLMCGISVELVVRRYLRATTGASLSAGSPGHQA